MWKVWNILNLVVPETCPTCQKESDSPASSPFCSSCWNDISTSRSHPRCPLCGTPLPSDYSFSCLSCKAKPPKYDRLFVFGNYEGGLREAIHLLKFTGLKRLSNPLGNLLNSISLPRVDAIVPVPLSKKRLIERGFNQSHLLARALSEKLSTKVVPDLLIKTKHTPAQSLLDRKERLRNQKGAFAIQKRKDKRIPGTVLLVDDVITTGATMNECSKVLKRAGVRRVYAVVLAKAGEEL